MLLAAGYFDESTDGEFEDRVFTVGGYVTAGYPAIHLDFRWRELLKKYDIAYFKASEQESLIGEFAKFRDDPKNATKTRFTDREKLLVREIKTDFINLLSQQYDLIGISATVHMRNLKELKANRPDLFKKLPPAYLLCAQLVMMDAGDVMNKTQAERPPQLHGLLRPVFDSHEEYAIQMARSFAGFCDKNPKTSRFLLPPIFENEQTYLCLQAADLFVYEVRRTVSNFFFEPKRDLRIAMQRLFPQINNTYVLDYETLKSLAEWQGSDKIGIQSIEAQYALSRSL